MTQANSLPARPNLAYLKKLAKQELAALRARKPGAQLAEVQLAIARRFGFPSWRKLKTHVETILAARMSAIKVPSPTSPKRGEWKPLMDAALAGDAQRVRKLLDAGADPNVQSTTGHRYRPLHRAIEHKKTMPKHEGHERVVELLLERRADPKLRGSPANTDALKLAAMGEPRFIPFLRKHFEPLNIFDAAILADEKRVQALLKSKPSLANAADDQNWRPLHYCAASVLHRADPEAADALPRIAMMLIDAGADPMAAFNYNEEWPLRPLYFACGLSNNRAVAKVLLEAGADPCDNESVYHAADEDHRECLDLIEQYVEPANLAQEATRCLPMQLHWGRTRGMKWLLEHGADPNVLHDRLGNAALHEAVKYGASPAVIETLLARGADPMRKNKDGQTAADLAKSLHRTRILAVLQSASRKVARR